MKAIRVHEFGGPEVLKFEDVPEPKPERGEILVHIHAAGVNPVETYIRSGTYARKPALPYSPGADGAGVITALGEGVDGFKVGARVYLSGSLTGTYAEQALCTEPQVHHLPEKVAFEQGAAMGVPYATAYRAMFQVGRAQPAETLLVHGASGGVGTAAVQLGRAAGLTVIGTGGTDKGRALVAEQGAQFVLDHSQPGYLDELMKLTAGKGVDLILEMLANVNLAKDLTVLALKGRVVVVGSRGTVEINPRETMGRDATIHGMTLMNVSPQELRSIHAALVAGLENGSLHPVVGQRLPLAEASRAQEEVMKPGAYGKIVLQP
ncbi:MAG: NADPH:quinone reductase [Terriglobales bacterium]|jgi:NADPH2:quinone reductase